VANLKRKKAGSWSVDRTSMRPLDIESLSLEQQCFFEALQEKSASTPMNERGEKEYVITREDVDARIAQKMKQKRADSATCCRGPGLLGPVGRRSSADRSAKHQRLSPLHSHFRTSPFWGVGLGRLGPIGGGG
jgi:hypothetical protein